MTQGQIRDVVLRVLAGIAPEADLSTVDPTTEFRDQLDLDSVDFLNFIVGLHTELGVDVPEVDYPKLSTVDACVEYLAAAIKA